jgi:hypothetical protein
MLPTTSSPDAPPLPDDLAVCQQMIRELLASLHVARRDNEQLRQRALRLVTRYWLHRRLVALPGGPPAIRLTNVGRRAGRHGRGGAALA